MTHTHTWVTNGCGGFCTGVERDHLCRETMSRDECNRRLQSHDLLVEALEAARNELVDESYGPFPGGDPRQFKPDPEACTPEEIEAHRLACIEWDKGEGEDRGPSCATFGDASAWTRTGYGCGTYTWGHDVVPTIDAALAAARGEGE